MERVEEGKSRLVYIFYILRLRQIVMVGSECQIQVPSVLDVLLWSLQLFSSSFSSSSFIIIITIVAWHHWSTQLILVTTRGAENKTFGVSYEWNLHVCTYIYIYSIRGRDYFSLTLLPQFRRFLLVVCINSTICFQVLLCLIYIKKYQTMASYGGNTGNERFVSVGDLISQLSLLSNNSRKLGRKRL